MKRGPVPSHRVELRAALALAEVEGLGPRGIERLVAASGSARAAVAALAAGRLPRIEDRDGRTRFGPELRRRLLGLRPAPESKLRALARRGIRVVARGCPGYPAPLERLYDPPAVLWLAGRGTLPEGRCVAVVGTRRATEYGRRVARDLAAGLARHGWTVTSGMATGIDGAAHRGALDAGGRTVGVLGSGLDHQYPSANAALYARMREAGLLASEFPPAEGPRKGYFPRRNRVIAALSDAVVVVQAGQASGALITAHHALDLGMEVFAVPGPVGAPGSAGVHGLLRDGAALATCAEDVLRELGVDPAGEAARAHPPDGPGRDGGAGAGSARALWARLAGGPRPVDELASAADLPVRETLALLGRLEVEGVVRALPGGRYERVDGVRAEPA